MGKALLFAVLAYGCAIVACNSGSSPSPDAPGGHGTLGFGSACNTVSDMSTECASGVCTNSFNMLPTPVCSQKCTVLGGSDASCPQGSMGQKCNAQGYCRP